MKLLSDNNDKNLRILDIDCALGDFTVQVKELLRPQELCAIDISEAAIRKAILKYKNSGIKFKTGSLPNLEEFKGESFNLVLASETFAT